MQSKRVDRRVHRESVEEGRKSNCNVCVVEVCDVEGKKTWSYARVMTTSESKLLFSEYM